MAPTGLASSWQSREHNSSETRISTKSCIAFTVSWLRKIAVDRNCAHQHGDPITESAFMTQDFVPGDFVRHPDQPEWGLGQVQSAIGQKLTVNFENRGKVVVNTKIVGLVGAAPPQR
jgi:hypothetical protein